MKGLFIKDLRLLKNQKSFFGAVLIMMIVFMSAYTNFSFVISYITVMFGILTLTTISYDDYENGLSYLFTLPVSRRTYAGEKYLFSIATTIPALAVVSSIAFIVSRIRGVDLMIEEWVSSVIGSLLVITLMLSILIPLQLKFGADKSRVAMMIGFGGGFLIVYVGIEACEALGIDWKAAIGRLELISWPVLLTGFVVLCGIIMVISFLFSLRVVSKREF